MSKLIQMLVPKLSAMIQSGGRSSAMKPMLCIGVVLFFAMVCMPSAVEIYGLSVKGALGAAFLGYILCATLAYFILLFKDPKLLQSEHYQLSMRRMDLAAQQLGRAPDFHMGNDSSQAILLEDEKEKVAAVETKLGQIENGAYPSETEDSEESK